VTVCIAGGGEIFMKARITNAAITTSTEVGLFRE
jgi:hypothetical protein